MRRINSCQEYFETIHERFIAEQARGVEATFLYDLAGPGGGTWTVTVREGRISVTQGAVAQPTVTYVMAADQYVKLANGELNGAKAFLTRKLKVQGSIAMAQKMNKFLPPAA